jgi:macrodomain Ter protein organizer (MatP/YcbG family)
VERKAGRKKAHRRVNVDRQVWEQLTRSGGGRANFSRLISGLLEDYVGRPSLAGRAGRKVSVDVTVDDALWTEASRLAHAQGLSLSHVIRELLQEHLGESRRRKPS